MARRLLLLLSVVVRALPFLVLLLLPAASSAGTATGNLDHHPPPPPTRFAVPPPPLSRALFPALEAARLHAFKVLAGGRSLYVDTSAGTPVHVLVFKSSARRGGAQAADLLPPIVLLHGVCSTAHDYAPLVRRLRRRCRR